MLPPTADEEKDAWHPTCQQAATLDIQAREELSKLARHATVTESVLMQSQRWQA
jgi:hypothetical protein